MNRITVEAEFNNKRDLIRLLERLKTVLYGVQTSPGDDQVLGIVGKVPDMNPMVYRVKFEYSAEAG
jgi:hypothetical protein